MKTETEIQERIDELENDLIYYELELKNEKSNPLMIIYKVTIHNIKSRIEELEWVLNIS